MGRYQAEGQSRNSITTYDAGKLKEAIKKNRRIHDTLNLEKYRFQTAVLVITTFPSQPYRLLLQ